MAAVEWTHKKVSAPAWKGQTPKHYNQLQNSY